MKKYIANIEHSGPVTDFTLCVGNECEQPDHGTEFYLATEVEDMTDRLLADKNARIAELERELQHVTRQRDETAEILKAANERIQALTFGSNRSAS